MAKKIIPDTVWVKYKSGKKRKSILQPPERIQIRTGKESDESDVKAAMEWVTSIKSSEDSVIEYIDGIEEVAKNRLKRNGFDPDIEMSYLLPNGGAASLGGFLEITQPRKPLWYAFRIIVEARCLRNHIEERNFFGALESAIQVAIAEGHLNISTFQPETLVGIDFMNQTGVGIKYTDEDKKRWRSIYDDVTTGGQNKTKTWIRDRIIKRLGLPKEAGRSVYDWIGEQKRQN